MNFIKFFTDLKLMFGQPGESVSDKILLRKNNCRPSQLIINLQIELKLLHKPGREKGMHYFGFIKLAADQRTKAEGDATFVSLI
jgi:hypothetical protein